MPAVLLASLVVALGLGPSVRPSGAPRRGPSDRTPAPLRDPAARPAAVGEAEGADPGDDPPAVEDEVRSLRIAAIEITGRDQVSRRQIVRALEREGLLEGELVRWPADPRIARARERLRTTGYFKSVALRLEPIPSRPDEVRLVVALIERSSIVLEELYLGSSRMTPFHGGISVLERNFLGRAVHVGGALVWGSMPRIDRSRRQQAYRFVAEVPRLGQAALGVRTSAFAISAAEPYRVAREADDPDPSGFRAVDVGRIGGTVGLVFPVLPTLTIGVDYRFERVDALTPKDPVWARPDGVFEKVDLGLRHGPHRLTSAHLGLVWDARNEVVLAGKGARVAFDLQLSSPATGSQYEYVKLVIAGGYTFRLPWRHWITPSISGGQIAGAAPIFERFYAGDLSAWTPGRELGIRYSTRNPIDVFGTGIDRRTFGALFGRFDLDYSVPLFRRARTRGVYGGDLFLGAGLFTLSGDAAERRAHRAAGERVAPLGFNANLGFRLDTAAGTFNVSIGNVLRRTPL